MTIPPIIKPNNYRYLIAIILLVITFRLVVSVTVEAGLNWDFVNFYNAGSRVFRGEVKNLFVAPSSDGKSPILQYVGFPLSAYFFAPLGFFERRAALLAFKAASAAAFTLGLFLLYGYCRDVFGGGWASSRSLFIYLFFILCCEPFWFVFVIGGQATPFCFLLMVLFIRYYALERYWLASLSLCSAVLLKPFLALTPALLLLAGEWKLIQRLVLCFVIAAAASLLVLGWDLHFEWIQIVLQEASRWAVRWWNNSTILGFFANFRIYPFVDEPQFGLIAPPLGFGIISLAFKAIVLTMFSWLILRTRKSGLSGLRRANHYLLLGVLFPMFFSTIAWPHYLTFLFIPLLFLIADLQYLSNGAKVLVVAIIIFILRADLLLIFTFHYNFPTPQTLPGTLLAGVISSGALIATMILLAFYHSEILKAAMIQQSNE